MRLFLYTSVLLILKPGVFLERERAAGRLKCSDSALVSQSPTPHDPNAAAAVRNQAGKV